jgi:hypothetical protein
MGMRRYSTLTEAELDEILADPECTLAEKILIAARIEQGELKVVAGREAAPEPN